MRSPGVVAENANLTSDRQPTTEHRVDGSSGQSRCDKEGLLGVGSPRNHRRWCWTVAYVIAAMSGTIVGWSRPLLALPATHLSVTARANVGAAMAFSVTVKALDGSDMIDTTYGGTV